MEDVGYRIALARKPKSLTQKDIAKVLGMPISTYAKKEKENDFTRDELDRILRFLKLSISDLQEFQVKEKGHPVIIQDSLSMIAGKIIQIEAMQRVQLTVLQELYCRALGIPNMEAAAVIDKALERELEKLRQELTR